MALHLIDEHGGWVERLPDLKGAVPVALGRHHKQSLYVAMRSRQMPAAPLISEGTSSSDVGTMLPGGFDVARRITAPYLVGAPRMALNGVHDVVVVPCSVSGTAAVLLCVAPETGRTS